MSPLDAIPNLRGLDGDGSVQVHQDAETKIEGAKVFSVYGKGGIGKSTFALKIAHALAVANAFQGERYQVALDGDQCCTQRREDFSSSLVGRKKGRLFLARRGRI